MSRTQRENIYAQATFSQKVWKVAASVMDMYEQGQVKDQRLNRKQLVATPEFRQHLMQPIHHLNPEFQHQILSDVVAGNKSLSELKQDAVNFRQLENIKQAFVSCTKSGNWDEARITYPLYTQVERLQKFVTLDFRQTIPDTFRHYCHSAVASNCISAGGNTTVQANGNFVCIVEGEPLQVTGQQLQSSCPSFSGAHLAVAAISEVKFVQHNKMG